MAPSPLIALADIISSGVRTLDAAYAKEGVPFPSLDEPFRPGAPSLEGDLALQQTTRLIIAAASQIIASVRHPMETVMDLAPAAYSSASLATVVEAHVPDVLQAGGNQVLGCIVDIAHRMLLTITVVYRAFTLAKSQLDPEQSRA